jgi:hypothetical protein
MPRDLYVAWQDPDTRTWRTIARLRRTGDEYEFLFTRGVTKLNSIPLDLFRMDVNKRYRSTDLIPLFRNRLLSRNRTDFHKVANWLGLKGDENEFVSLSKFGLIPGSDSILIYPAPELVDRNYSVEFFVHGIRHMHADMASHCDLLSTGSPLLPLLDVKNPADPNAVAFRTETDFRLIGYLPAFYAGDVRTILSKPALANEAKIFVVKNNKDAPVQLRLLCRFEVVVDQDFVSLNSEAHTPLLGEAA